METTRVKYPKEMRQVALETGKHLITIDVPGMIFQGPCTTSQRREAIEMVTRWFKENNSGSQDR